MDWLIKELVDKNILQLPDMVKIEDYVGHYKIIDGVEQKANDPVPPVASLAQIRQVERGRRDRGEGGASYLGVRHFQGHLDGCYCVE